MMSFMRVKPKPMAAERRQFFLPERTVTSDSYQTQIQVFIEVSITRLVCFSTNSVCIYY